MTRFAVAAALLLATGAGLAAEAKGGRPVACLDFSIAKLTDGSTVGMCEGRKGKKPHLLRGYAVATVVNPETGLPAKLLVGFP